jgi:hypothetical protein
MTMSLISTPDITDGIIRDCRISMRLFSGVCLYVTAGDERPLETWGETGHQSGSAKNHWTLPWLIWIIYGIEFSGPFKRKCPLMTSMNCIFNRSIIQSESLSWKYNLNLSRMRRRRSNRSIWIFCRGVFDLETNWDTFILLRWMQKLWILQKLYKHQKGPEIHQYSYFVRVKVHWNAKFHAKLTWLTAQAFIILGIMLPLS